MSLGNILGQILQQGMAGQSRSRLEHTVGPEGLGGMPGLGDLLGAVLGGNAGGRSGGLGDLLGGASGTRPAAAGAGGLGDLFGGMLGGQGGRPAATGGLGDLLGGLLGGGTQRSGGNPLGSAGMAILATVAMAALKNWQQSGRGSLGLTADMTGLPQEEIAAMTSDAAEELVLRAMIAACKADGEVDETELQRIVDRIDDDGVSAAEKQFLIDELRKPLDLQALAADVPNSAVAAQVYAASLLAIDLDSEAEHDYMRQLGELLELDRGTITRLHEMTGAPGA
jgi:uncharacterized membrane protein YebE (DUF533 family)